MYATQYTKKIVCVLVCLGYELLRERVKSPFRKVSLFLLLCLSIWLYTFGGYVVGCIHV